MGDRNSLYIEFTLVRILLLPPYELVGNASPSLSQSPWPVGGVICDLLKNNPSKRTPFFAHLIDGKYARWESALLSARGSAAAGLGLLVRSEIATRRRRGYF